MSSKLEENRAHWNENAATYNAKFEKTIQQLIDEIQKRKEWIGVDWVDEELESDGEFPSNKNVRLLDYACGTGLVSRALAPYVTQSIGVDISAGMAAEYNKTAQNQGIPQNEMYASVGNLLDPHDPAPAALSDPKFFEFDIAVVGLGFHHFDDPFLATKRLTERLKKGGILMIIDFMPHQHNHIGGARNTVTHAGFDERDVTKMFVDAGAGGDFDYTVVGNGIVFVKAGQEGKDMKRGVFMARGTKL